MPRSTGRVVATVPVTVAATLAGAALVAALVVPRGDDDPTGGTAVSATNTTPSTATPSSTTRPSEPQPGASLATQAPDAAVAPPARVAVPRLGIDMAVQPEGVNDAGQMALPPTPEVVGWYQFGSAPDDPTGATVLAAHVDGKAQGVGPFVRLGSARTGDEVDVWVGGQRHAYRVTQVSRIDKATLDADGLFSITGSPRVHLVTCTGAYLSGSGYQQNLVVVAEPR